MDIGYKLVVELKMEFPPMLIAYGIKEVTTERVYLVMPWKLTECTQRNTTILHTGHTYMVDIGPIEGK